MENQEFDYNFIEVVCSDLKIIFITDEKTTVTGHSDIHMHSFWELFFLQEGNLTVTVDAQRYELSKNQAFIIPPGVYHSTKSDSNVVKTSVFFAFEKVKSQEEEKLFEKVHGAFCGCGFYKVDDAYVGRILELILENNSADKAGKVWRIKANVTELVFRLYDRVNEENLLRLDSPLNQNAYWVYKYAIDRLLDLHYMNDISLEALSEKLFVSPQTVTRVISSAYGKSFNELKLELKMRNAKKMLRETQLSVNEIGNRIGYTSSRGFLSAFLKYEGCTPSEYRKSCI